MKFKTSIGDHELDFFEKMYIWFELQGIKRNIKNRRIILSHGMNADEIEICYKGKIPFYGKPIPSNHYIITEIKDRKSIDTNYFLAQS